MRKQAGRHVSAPWLDQELKGYMKQRDNAKKEAIKTTNLTEWNEYRKLQNLVTKLNKNKKRCYYQKIDK